MNPCWPAAGVLDRMPLFPNRLEENPPREGFLEHTEYLKVRAQAPASYQLHGGRMDKRKGQDSSHAYSTDRMRPIQGMGHWSPGTQGSNRSTV